MYQNQSRWVSAQPPKAWAAHRAELDLLASRKQESQCPACGGIGWLREDAQPGDPGFGQLTPCETCSGERRLQWLTQNCGLEMAELDVTLAGWLVPEWPDPALVRQREDARDAIIGALVRRCGLLTFWGDFGGGKTRALWTVVNEARLELIESYYAPMSLVLDHLRSLLGASRESSRFWQRLLDVPVLALDEVTRFYETGWAEERLWILSDVRYRRRHSHLTVFATNEDPRRKLPPAEAAGYLLSRMREGRLVELRGDVRRMAANSAGTEGR